MDLHDSEPTSQTQPFDQTQRIQVRVEGEPGAKRVRISLEGYAEGLGWYAAGSIVFPAHQLPILEQAIQNLQDAEQREPTESDQIIPFPGLRLAGSW